MFQSVKGKFCCTNNLKSSMASKHESLFPPPCPTRISSGFCTHVIIILTWRPGLMDKLLPGILQVTCHMEKRMCQGWPGWYTSSRSDSTGQGWIQRNREVQSFSRKGSRAWGIETSLPEDRNVVLSIPLSLCPKQCPVWLGTQLIFIGWIEVRNPRLMAWLN